MPGASPDGADARGAAIEDHFAEDAEQNLRGAAARGPADGDHADAEDQRRGAHVAQASMYSCQGRTTSASVSEARGGRKPRPGKNSREMQNAEIRNESALPTNAHLIAELRDAGAAQKRADRQRGPLRGLGQRIGGVQFLLGGDGGQNGGAPAGEERRGRPSAVR